MGASINAFWPEITEEQMGSQPGFFNDDNAWGNFMAESSTDNEVIAALEKLNAKAVLTTTTDGMPAEEVDWVTPGQLANAAKTLRDAVKSGSPETKTILDCYTMGANDIDPISDELIQDLSDIEAISDWAQAEGAERMTLEVNW
jgi:hypothetical protein